MSDIFDRLEAGIAALETHSADLQLLATRVEQLIEAVNALGLAGVSVPAAQPGSTTPAAAVPTGVGPEGQVVNPASLPDAPNSAEAEQAAAEQVQTVPVDPQHAGAVEANAAAAAAQQTAPGAPAEADDPDAAATADAVAADDAATPGEAPA